MCARARFTPLRLSNGKREKVPWMGRIVPEGKTTTTSSNSRRAPFSETSTTAPFSR